MRFYLPKIKDQIVLTSDWSFRIFSEYRNKSLLRIVDPNHNVLKAPVPVTLSAGTILSVERVYIVNNNILSTATITFKVMRSPDNSNCLKARFWVYSEDANKIEFKQ